MLGKAPKSVRPGALRDPQRRAQQIHAFLHHELQAAELMAWARLAFADSPIEFRRGLLRIAGDEIRHMRLYRGHLRALGFEVGDFPVRDWFWLRVPRAETPAAFVALMGIGLEGGNLDHATEFARQFREVGDEEGARIQEQVAAEEVGHVRFAARWFAEFTGGLDFDSWSAHIPPPVTPTMLRRKPINTRDRSRAGLDQEFLGRLEQS